eukprot:TRINITY_DN3227_c3_g1_i5.p3 TRINITY_DN3227_c3_g1~~TRINITY_DN3227_c3_g1_i5.p3  ORF type:complete len:319 (-),score=88.53 TRINITY_DN3227_c3_g1_i5:1678-2634(-)
MEDKFEDDELTQSLSEKEEEESRTDIFRRNIIVSCTESKNTRNEKCVENETVEFIHPPTYLMNKTASIDEMIDYRKKINKYSTGNLEIDMILNGGIEAGIITECFGKSGVGKTQLCHTLAVTCQLGFVPNLNWKYSRPGKCLYFDTEGTFRPNICEQIAQRFNIDSTMVTDNIVFARVYNSDAQQTLLDESQRLLENGDFSLIIVDSVSSLFRTDYSGNAVIERQMLLARYLKTLERLATEYDVAVFITNQVVANISKNLLVDSKRDNYKAVGGNIMEHISNVRLKMEKINGNRRLSICSASHLAKESCNYFIDKGIC